MFRILFGLLIILSTTWGVSYQIRLGSFESYEALQATLSKLQNPQYKQKLSIEQDDATGYTLYSKTFAEQAQAQKALDVYTSVFEGAMMTKDGVPVSFAQHKEEKVEALVVEQAEEKPDTTLWENVQTKPSGLAKPEQDKPQAFEVPKVIQKPHATLPKENKNLSFSKELQRKVFYLCYEGKKQGRIKPVIKAIFNQFFITYSSQMIEIPPIVTPYKLVGNDLHITVGMFSVGGTKSRLVRVTDKYLRVINWADGKPVQSVRFYYTHRDALAFSQKN